MQKKSKLTKRRDFLKKAGLVTAGAVGASTLAAQLIRAIVVKKGISILILFLYYYKGPVNFLSGTSFKVGFGIFICNLIFKKFPYE